MRAARPVLPRLAPSRTLRKIAEAGRDGTLAESDAAEIIAALENVKMRLKVSPKSA